MLQPINLNEDAALSLAVEIVKGESVLKFLSYGSVKSYSQADVINEALSLDAGVELLTCILKQYLNPSLPTPKADAYFNELVDYAKEAVKQICSKHEFEVVSK